MEGWDHTTPLLRTNLEVGWGQVMFCHQQEVRSQSHPKIRQGQKEGLSVMVFTIGTQGFRGIFKSSFCL